MGETTRLFMQSAAPRRIIQGCHGGVGPLDFTPVLAQQPDARVKFVHDDLLPPGSSIGVHRHESGEEYYFVISGSGLMQLDGVDYEVTTGDLAAVYAGGSHGLSNNSDQDLRILVFFAGDAERA